MSDSGPVSEEKIAQEVRSMIAMGQFDRARVHAKQLVADPTLRQSVLEEIEAAQNRMNVGSSSASESFSVETLQCPSCRGSLSRAISESETLTCPACGAVIDISKHPFSVLDQQKPTAYAPASFISLGMLGTFENETYQVIGRICYSSSMQEWDTEDNQYYPETWVYDTWILLGESKRYLYISEDREGYSLAKPFTPTSPALPEGQSQLALMTDHVPQRVIEYGTTSVTYFEGEFTWLPRVGEKGKFAEYRYGAYTYSTEARLKKGAKEIAEVEFYESRSISKLELARAFDIKEIILEEAALARKEGELRRLSYLSYAVGGILTLLFFGSCSVGSTAVASYEVDFTRLPESGLTKGPIELSEEGSIYQLTLSTSIPDNSYSWGAIELLDEKKAPINAFEGDFWRESGYDSDGRWSESSVSTSHLFKLETPGTYYVRFFSEKGTASRGKLRFALSEGISLSRYYFIGLLGAFGFGFSMRKYKSANPFYMLIGIFAIAGIIISSMGDD